jgi:hypothetical protein
MNKKEVRTPKHLADIVIDLIRRIKPEGLKSSNLVKRPLSALHGDELIMFVVSSFTPMCKTAFSEEFEEEVAQLVLNAMGSL